MKNDIIKRAVKTFFQAVIGYFCTVGITGIDFDSKTAVIGFVLGAIAAGLSALMNIEWTKAIAEKEVEITEDLNLEYIEDEDGEG